MEKLDIARTMKQHGFTARRLAEKIGISDMAMSARINGNPTVNSLGEIAEAIGCNITDLFYREGEDKINDAPTDGLFAQPSTDVTAEAQGAEKTAEAQDAREMMYCPHCGTKFFVVNVPNRG